MQYSRNKTRSLVRVVYGILASTPDLVLEAKAVPVSNEPYVKVSFGFTSNETQRRDHANRLLEIRKNFIAEVREKGMNVRAEDGPLFKYHYIMWKDGVESSFEVEPVAVDFYLPFFNVYPRVRRQSS